VRNTLVRFWFILNEIFGGFHLTFLFQKTLQAYDKTFRRFAPFFPSEFPLRLLVQCLKHFINTGFFVRFSSIWVADGHQPVMVPSLLFIPPPLRSLLQVGFITLCQYKPTIEPALDDTVGIPSSSFRCYSAVICWSTPRLITLCSSSHRPVCQGSLHSVTQLLIKTRSWCSRDKKEGQTKGNHGCMPYFQLDTDSIAA